MSRQVSTWLCRILVTSREPAAVSSMYTTRRSADSRRRVTSPRVSSRSRAEEMVEMGARSSLAILRTFHFPASLIATSKPTSLA